MELAPFDRAGQVAAARALADPLEQERFPQLAPQFAPAFAAIRQHYRDLLSDLALHDFQTWSQHVVDIVVAAVAAQGLMLRCVVHAA